MAAVSQLRFAATLALAGSLIACGAVHIQSPITTVAGPPSSFTPTTSDVRTTKIVDLPEGVAKPVAFKAATDLLTQKYSIDVSDSKAGFLMTPWQAGASHQGSPDFHYRTRVIIRFLGDEWKQASVRAEANWQRADGWDVGVDTKLLEEVATDLAARLGRK